MYRYLAPLLPARPGTRSCLGLAALVLLAACEEPRPRSFTEFMDDRIAREGTIAHCNQNPVETANEIECANARRAAATIALRAERERREALERESERKLEAMRNEMAERERIVRESTLAAARAEREAYESLWRRGVGAEVAGAADDETVGPPTDRLSLIEVPPLLRRDPGQ